MCPIKIRLGNATAFKVLFAVAMGIWFTSTLAVAADLTAHTTEWAPYSFAVEGRVTGISTEILEAACAEAKLTCEFQITPWARAYATVSKTPNTVLYTTARIRERENEFLWVGPVLPRVTWVYGRAGTQSRFKTFRDLANARIGVVRGESSIKDLEGQGIPSSAFDRDSANNLVLRSLHNELVDAMVDTEIGMAWNLRESNLAPDTVVKLMKLSDNGAYYFALNRATDPVVQAKLQNALDKLKQSGALTQIVRKYIGSQ